MRSQAAKRPPMLWVQVKPCNSALAISDRVRKGSRIAQEGHKKTKLLCLFIRATCYPKQRQHILPRMVCTWGLGRHLAGRQFQPATGNVAAT